MRAFTLIEVLVVVGIIAVLAAALMPALKLARERSRRVVCASNLHQIMTGVQMYSDKYGGHVPYSLPAFNASLTWIGWQGFHKPNGWVHLGLLYGTKILPNPRILFCAANDLYPHIYPDGWDDKKFAVGSNGIERKATGYMYGIAGEIRRYPKGQRSYVQLARLKQREALVSCMFLGRVSKQQPERLWPHPEGINVAYIDGSVQMPYIRPAVAKYAFKLYKGGTWDESDYFAFCFFRMLSGEPSWMNKLVR